MVKVLVFWLGIIGIAGKGANWVENYDPNKTLEEITRNMELNNLGERNKKIKILKHKYGSLNYDVNDPYWKDETKLSEYINYYGGLNGQYVQMIYVIV